MSVMSGSADDLDGTRQTRWHGFLVLFEPLRPELYRFCRYLTRSAWDAEDLSQDALARAFATLAQMGEPPPNPRAWLLRVASNLWIDRARAREGRREVPLAEQEGQAPAAVAIDPRATREAAGTLLGQLSPYERAAVVLKDVFDLSLEETAEALATTVGAVKAALHRGRGKLVDPLAQEPTPQPPHVLDAFCAAFNAGDLDRLASLLLDTSRVELSRAVTRRGPDAARQTVLAGMLFGVKRMVAGGLVEARFSAGVLARLPRVEARNYRGEWVLLHWFAHADGEAVRAVTRIQADDDGARIAQLVHHFFEPDLIADIVRELGLPWRSNGYRWVLPDDGVPSPKTPAADDADGQERRP
jgi:RNA polymerase sigma-70 factor (ECF subfamily)